MVELSVPQGDDLIALTACCAAFSLCVFAIQLVYFLRHRKRFLPGDTARLSAANTPASRPPPHQHDSAA